jgi:predicted transcriptional regulator of viral defense system
MRLSEAGVGAFFHPRDLEALGITYAQLRRLVETGTVEHVAHGLYRLRDVEATEHYSLAAACARVPRSIVCLLSALKVHGIGTRLSRDVWLAIPHKARPPRAGGVRIRIVRFTGASWTYGIQDTAFEGVPARVTNPARTIVDCFRFERLVGRETAMEALREGLRSRTVTPDALIRTLEVLPSRRLKTALETMDQ